MTATQSPSASLATLRQRVVQLESAPILQQAAIARQALSETVEVLERFEERLQGLERLEGIL